MTNLSTFEKVKRAAIWTLLQSALTACVIYGGVFDHAWALRIYEFFTWFFTIVFAILFTGKVLGTKRELGPLPVPAWITLVTDFAIATILAACGHWFYAALQVLQQLLEQYVFEVNTPDQKG